MADYDLGTGFAGFASRLTDWCDHPPSETARPCAQGVAWGQTVPPQDTFADMLGQMLSDAADPAVSATAQDLAGWLTWCIMTPEVSLSPSLLAAMALTITQLTPHRHMQLFRLWLALPRSSLSDHEEALLLASWMGKLPRVEQMLAEGRLTRAL